MDVSTRWNAFEDISVYFKVTGGALLAGGVAYLLWNKLKQEKRKTYPHNTVILHQIGRGPNIPSLTPFAVKLETYLRLSKIPYENEHDCRRSSKGKFPWIEYNGECIADSEFCIEFLNKEREINLNSHLSSEQDSIGRAFQKMLEENTYWTFMMDRYVYNDVSGIMKALNEPWILQWKGIRKMYNQAYSQGVGRHTKEEVFHIMRTDLQALSNFLGSKDFLFGERPCQYDCAVFGVLAELKWAAFGGASEEIIHEFPNLCDYCARMRSRFWQDWK